MTKDLTVGLIVGYFIGLATSWVLVAVNSPGAIAPVTFRGSVCNLVDFQGRMAYEYVPTHCQPKNMLRPGEDRYDGYRGMWVAFCDAEGRACMMTTDGMASGHVCGDFGARRREEQMGRFLPPGYRASAWQCDGYEWHAVQVVP